MESALDPLLTARAFAYLTVHTVKNRLLSRLRRAKNPRYALALVLGAGYLWMVYGRQLSAVRSATPSGAYGNAMWIVIGTAFLLVMTGIAWFVPNGPSNLALDKAEAAFIVPGPVSGRGLIGYKLLRAQLAIFTTVVIWTLLLRRGSASLALPLRGLGVWMFFTTTNLHRTGAEIVRAAWAIRGGGAMRKHWVPTGIVIAAIIGLAISLGLSYNPLVAAIHAGFNPTLVAVAAAMATGPAAVVLWPIRAVLGPMIATSNAQWLGAAPAALIVLVVHAVWVFRSDDEAVAGAVTRATERMEVFRTRATQRGAVRTARPKPDAVLKTMPLAPTGWPAMAIVWKNVLSMRRKTRSSLRLLGFVSVAPLIWGAIAMTEGGGAAGGIAVIAISVAAILLLIGPLMLRNDLRDDMLNLTALKLIPLTGRTIVTAEVLSVVIPLAVAQCLLVLLAAITTLSVSDRPFGPGQTALLLVGVLPALVAFNAAFVTIQNAAPVLFPAWTKLGALTSGGMEAMGQMMIVVGLVLVLMILMLLVPGVVAAGIIFAGRSYLIPATVGGLVAASASLAVEVFMLITILGRTLERTEPSDVSV